MEGLWSRTVLSGFPDELKFKWPSLAGRLLILRIHSKYSRYFSPTDARTAAAKIAAATKSAEASASGAASAGASEAPKPAATPSA